MDGSPTRRVPVQGQAGSCPSTACGSSHLFRMDTSHFSDFHFVESSSCLCGFLVLRCYLQCVPTHGGAHSGRLAGPSQPIPPLGAVQSDGWVGAAWESLLSHSAARRFTENLPALQLALGWEEGPHEDEAVQGRWPGTSFRGLGCI